MSLSAALLPEFDQEMANLRRTLERVPDEKFGYKPHPKSNTMGWLANHLANLAGWSVVTMKQDGLDFTPDFKMPEGKTTQEVLAIFDKNVVEARAAIAAGSDGRGAGPCADRRVLCPCGFKARDVSWEPVRPRRE